MRIIQVTAVCAAVLLVLALLLALLNALRGWRWSRFSLSVLALLGAGVSAFVANRAQEAWQPFAALHMPPDASYNDWVIRITSATLYAFTPTVDRFRGFMILSCLLVLAMVIAATVQSVALVRERNEAREPARRLADAS